MSSGCPPCQQYDPYALDCVPISDGYHSGDDICCQNGEKISNDKCCGEELLEPGKFCCTEDGDQPETEGVHVASSADCCGGKPLEGNEECCAGKEIYDPTEDDSDCCEEAQEVYHSDVQYCCKEKGSVEDEGTPEYGCCDKADGSASRNQNGMKCCGGQEYDPSQKCCYQGQFVECCGGDPLEPGMFCCEGTREIQVEGPEYCCSGNPVEEPGECCGETKMTGDECCCGDGGCHKGGPDKLEGVRVEDDSKCCGGQPVKSEKYCCDGTPVTRPKDCCGGDTVLEAGEECCGGEAYTPGEEECCGDDEDGKLYDPEDKCCCAGDELKNKPEDTERGGSGEDDCDMVCEEGGCKIKRKIYFRVETYIAKDPGWHSPATVIGTKTLHTFYVDSTSGKVSQEKKKIGRTHLPIGSIGGSGKLTRKVSLSACTLNVIMNGTARNNANPLLSDIDYTVNLKMDLDSGEKIIKTHHDGYPTYVVILDTCFYKHDETKISDLKPHKEIKKTKKCK